MNFTAKEKDTLIKNSKEIFNFIKTEVVPYLRDSFYVNFDCQRGTYNMLFGIHPDNVKGGPGCITMKRNSIGSTVYDVGPDDADHYTKTKVDFFQCFDEMYYLISNWSRIKSEIMKQTECDKQIGSTILNFKL